MTEFGDTSAFLGTTLRDKSITSGYVGLELAGQDGTGSSGDLIYVRFQHALPRHGLLLFSLVAADVYFPGLDSR